MRKVGIFYGHLESVHAYITAILYILWAFGNLVAIWYIVSRKIWQPWSSYKWYYVRLIGHFNVGHDAVGQTLVGQNLVGQNLVGQNLVGQNLVGQNLAGQNLVGQIVAFIAEI
jgi:uncharacterized protein YjbI with pentapeptide repeats